MYNIHTSKIRSISEDVANNEMMIDYNGPEIEEVDKLPLESLYRHFKKTIVKEEFIFILKTCLDLVV